MMSWMRMSQSASDSRMRAVEMLWETILQTWRGGKCVTFLTWVKWGKYLFQVRTCDMKQPSSPLTCSFSFHALGQLSRDMSASRTALRTVRVRSVAFAASRRGWVLSSLPERARA
jgi:hypothetical protein